MKKLVVNVYAQDIAGNKMPIYLTLPMEKEDLEKALKPLGWEEFYHSFDAAYLWTFLDSENKIHDTEHALFNKALGDICDRLSIWDCNKLIKYFNENKIFNAIDLLFYADSLGLVPERIIKMEDFDDSIKELGWSATQVLTQIDDFNLNDDYFILDENNLGYSVNVHELQDFADGEAWELVKKLFSEEIAA